MYAQLTRCFSAVAELLVQPARGQSALGWFINNIVVVVLLLLVGPPSSKNRDEIWQDCSVLT